MLAGWVNRSRYFIVLPPKIEWKFVVQRFRFGFAYVPTQPGCHSVDISTWKIAANSYVDTLKLKFNTGGFTVTKSDLIYSGNERFDSLLFGSFAFAVAMVLIWHISMFLLLSDINYRRFPLAK